MQALPRKMPAPLQISLIVYLGVHFVFFVISKSLEFSKKQFFNASTSNFYLMHQPQPQICRRKDQFYLFEYEIKLKWNNFHSKKNCHILIVFSLYSISLFILKLDCLSSLSFVFVYSFIFCRWFWFHLI